MDLAARFKQKAVEDKTAKGLKLKKTRSKSMSNYDDLDNQLEITENLLYEMESLITEVMYDLDNKINSKSNNTPPIEISSRLRFLSAQFGGLSKQIDENLDDLKL